VAFVLCSVCVLELEVCGGEVWVWLVVVGVGRCCSSGSVCV
jgi:hypothetical protein